MRKGSKLVEIQPGQRFGLLKVLRFSHYFNRRSYWHCQCDCGKLVTVKKRLLKETKSPSCGCLPKNSTRHNTATEKESNQIKWNAVMNLSHWEGDCLIWDGYMEGTTPKMSHNNVVIGVRRWVYLYFNKTIPEKIFISCTCRNYRCINIKHIGVSTNGRQSTRD